MNYLDYFRDFWKFRQLSDGRLPVRWQDRHPCLYEDTSETKFDRHYIYHPAWAARVLAKTKPKKHVDISSTLAFCTIISAFIPVEFYDFRPAAIKLSGLSSKHADLTALPFKDNSILSLSCMHTLEHIGLGRYGDALDPDGDIKSMEELKRVLAPGGNLLIVVPVGRPRVQFNAHRIYSYQQIINYFSPLKLIEFSLIPDDPHAGLIKDASENLANNQRYGCGCFWFQNMKV